MCQLYMVPLRTILFFPTIHTALALLFGCERLRSEQLAHLPCWLSSSIILYSRSHIKSSLHGGAYPPCFPRFSSPRTTGPKFLNMPASHPASQPANTVAEHDCFSAVSSEHVPHTQSATI